MDFSPDQLSLFWAKSVPAEFQSGDTRAYKSVPHHLLDVAAVAFELQVSSPRRLARDARLWRCEEADLARTRAFLCGLHDLGKISRCFQSKVPELWPEAILGSRRELSDIAHWVITGRMLEHEALSPRIAGLFPGLRFGGEEEVGYAVAGHHGRPPLRTENERSPLPEVELFGPSARVGAECLEAATAMLDILTQALGPVPLIGVASMAMAQKFTWSLAGLTTLSDWIGSDETFFFNHDPPDLAAEVYWPLARARAKEALSVKGLSGARLPRESGLAQVFPEIAANPRPLQIAVDQTALPDGPVLAILEDATGAGKTEAAVTLASRWLAAGKGEGVYFALPTMATANAMFGRLEGACRRLFDEGETPSLALAHGKTALSARFQEVRAAAVIVSRAEPDSALAQCAAWIADDRRRAFFAEVGVGTVDQALLSVLPKRHLTLRQYGLAGRVLILDEVHSFDLYTSRAIERLLSFHAAAGGSAILLSATLPQTKRADLVAAFTRGMGSATPKPSASSYPLLCLTSDDGLVEQPVAPVPATVRSVAIERIDTEDAALRVALTAASKGAAVLWVRNAVDDARAAASALRAAEATVDLYHARFAMVDRLQREEKVLRLFGKEARAEDRNGRILVSTQVCEQSLDVDFDVLISDLAPIDALIQRTGRQWRHMDRRPAARRPVDRPTLYLLAADPDDVDSVAWLRATQKKGGWVYPHAGVMWRTARALVDAGAIVAPDGLRGLIERVYGADDVPPALDTAQLDAIGEDGAAATLAELNLVDLDAGYTGIGAVDSDQEIGTRLGRPTKTLRLARRAGDALAPWAAEEPEARRAWALSEVSCDANWVADLAAPEALAPMIVAARADWPAWDPTIIAVVDGGVLQLATHAGETPLTYCPETGLARRSPPARG